MKQIMVSFESSKINFFLTFGDYTVGAEFD